MVLTARWKDNLHELPRSTGCTSAALNMIKLYCLIQKKPVFFKLIWNESPIQAFIPPMCFPGFLNHHKFRTNQKHLVNYSPLWKPQGALTALTDIFGDRGVLVWQKRPWMFMMFFRSTNTRGSTKREANGSPPKRDIRHWRQGRNFFEPWCFASVFFWGMKPLQQRQLLTPNQTLVQSSQKKMRSLYIFVSLEGFPKSLFLHCSFQVVPYEYHNEPTIYVQMCNMREEMLPGEPSEHAVTTSSFPCQNG